MTLYCTSYDSVLHAAMHALNFVDAYHCYENGNDIVCANSYKNKRLAEIHREGLVWSEPRSTLPFFSPCQHCLKS